MTDQFGIHAGEFCEDSSLTALMTQFAEEDGARLLQLYQACPECEETDLEALCSRTIREQLRCNPLPCFFRRGAKAAACLLGTILFLGLLTFSLSSEARASMLRWITRREDQAITYSPVVEETEAGEFLQYEIRDLPEEYALLEELSSAVPGFAFYENPEGNQVTFLFQPPDGRGTLYLIPGEDEILRVAVNGIPADLYVAAEENKSSNIVWTDPDTGYLLMVKGVFSQEELILLAESVVRSEQ